MRQRALGRLNRTEQAGQRSYMRRMARSASDSGVPWSGPRAVTLVGLGGDKVGECVRNDLPDSGVAGPMGKRDGPEVIDTRCRMVIW